MKTSTSYNVGAQLPVHACWMDVRLSFQAARLTATGISAVQHQILWLLQAQPSPPPIRKGRSAARAAATAARGATDTEDDDEAALNVKAAPVSVKVETTKAATAKIAEPMQPPAVAASPALGAPPLQATADTKAAALSPQPAAGLLCHAVLLNPLFFLFSRAFSIMALWLLSRSLV